jgi:hypothetical protein
MHLWLQQGALYWCCLRLLLCLRQSVSAATTVGDDGQTPF